MVTVAEQACVGEVQSDDDVCHFHVMVIVAEQACVVEVQSGDADAV